MGPDVSALVWILPGWGISLALITVLYLKSKPLPPPQLGLTTRILDSRGNLIDTLDHGERRVPVQLKELPRSIQEATLAAEDQRFYEHRGFSPKGILRGGMDQSEKGSGLPGGQHDHTTVGPQSLSDP